MSGPGVHKPNALWAPLPDSGVDVGPNTNRPFGLNPGQFIDAIVNSKSYSITSSVGNGNTSDRPLPTFSGTTLQDKTAFIYEGDNTAFIDNSVGNPSGGQFVLEIGGGITYYTGGLFYPIIVISMSDGSGNNSGTMGTGATGQNATFFGAAVALYVNAGTPVGQTCTVIQDDGF